MKKFYSIISIAMVLVLSLPIVSGATGSPFAPQIHTLDSVTGFYDDAILNQEQRYLSNYNGDYINTFYEKFAEIESLIDFSYNYWAAYLYYNSNTDLEHYTIAVRVWNDSSDVVGVATSLNTSTLQSTYDVIYSCKDTVSSYYHGKIYSYNFNSSTPQWNWEWIYSSSNTTEFSSLSDGIILLDTNVPIYLNENIISNGGSQVTTSNVLQFVPSSSYNVFFDNNLPYSDENGTTVNPGDSGSSIETTANNVYLTNCDIGFCSPYGTTDLSSAGGGYLYVKYDYNDFISRNLSDYHLNIDTDVLIDGNHYTGTKDQTINLDKLNIIQLKNVSTAFNGSNFTGLCCLQLPEQLKDSYYVSVMYSMPFLTMQQNKGRFLGSGRSNRMIVSGRQNGREIGVNTSDDVIESLWTLLGITTHNQYLMTVNVTLLDSEGNESGNYQEVFDFVKGTSKTTMNDITVNDNPYEPPEGDITVPSDDTSPAIQDGWGKFNGVFYGTSYINMDWQTQDIEDTVNTVGPSSGSAFKQAFEVYSDDAFLTVVDDYFNAAFPPELKALMIGTGASLCCLAFYRWFRRG